MVLAGLFRCGASKSQDLEALGGSRNLPLEFK
jgi:hypothetical protein